MATDTYAETERIVRSRVLWAMGAGLIPVPLVDFAAVTGIQVEMLKQLSEVHGLDFQESIGKNIATALTGTTLAALGASLLKVIPVIGSIIGGRSMGPW